MGVIAMTLVANTANSFEFNSIDGDIIDIKNSNAKAILVINTASKCGFTKQLGGMQTLFENYSDDGLLILAVPSDDFRQELATEEAVKNFCEVNYNLTLPMTEITHVKGDKAHPFFKWAKENYKYKPKWNFYKILLDKELNLIDTYSSATKPLSPKLVKKIEAELY